MPQVSAVFDVRLSAVVRVTVDTAKPQSREEIKAAILESVKAFLDSTDSPAPEMVDSYKLLEVRSDVDDSLLVGAFEKLRDHFHQKPKSRSQALRDAGFTRRPSARSLPSDA